MNFYTFYCLLALYVGYKITKFFSSMKNAHTEIYCNFITTHDSGYVFVIFRYQQYVQTEFS